METFVIVLIILNALLFVLNSTLAWNGWRNNKPYKFNIIAAAFCLVAVVVNLI